MQALIVRIIITTVATVFLYFHVFKHWDVDLATIALMVLTIFPWLGEVFKSLELPGVLKAEYRDAIAAVKQSTDIAGLSTSPSEVDYKRKKNRDLFELAKEDPNLALASLRIEIEKRLRELAGPTGERTSVGQLLRLLGQKEKLTSSEVSALRDVVNLLNQAMHGGEIPEAAVRWALETGPTLLDNLDIKINASTKS